jgi:hypothetical protein
VLMVDGDGGGGYGGGLSLGGRNLLHGAVAILGAGIGFVEQGCWVCLWERAIPFME